jgi:uncharacterized protein YigE (DUF2233 family)
LRLNTDVAIRFRLGAPEPEESNVVDLMAARAFAKAMLGFVVLLAFAGSAHAAPACRAVRFEGDRFAVCRYSAREDELRLENRNGDHPVGGFATLKTVLGRDAGRVRFAMNAGMYDEGRFPLGLYVAGGKRLHALNRGKGGSGNFFLKPNGVFWTDRRGGPHIDTTEAYAERDPEARWATQSGPMLVIGGAMHPAIMPNGDSLNVRNGVGVKGGEAFFAISDGPVSFGRFARLFRDALGCPDALYFDGSVSSAWIPEQGRMDGRSDLGTFVVVLKKRSAAR